MQRSKAVDIQQEGRTYFSRREPQQAAADVLLQDDSEEEVTEQSNVDDAPPDADDSEIGALFTTNLSSQALDIGTVILKDICVLRKFTVINLSPDKVLRIGLSSSLGEEQIGFQLNNENLHSNLDEDDYNQLFNFINRIDEVTLYPRQKKSVVLSFLPQPLQEEEEDTSASMNTSDKPHSFFNVTGEIYLTLLSAVTQSGENTSLEDEAFHPLTVEESPQQQKLAIPFIAKVCRSELRIDVHEIAFDHCVLGGSYVKDFTIRNFSEMPLSFTVKTEDFITRERILQFTDTATGSPVHDHVIPSYSSLDVRVIFKPIAEGEANYTIHIENTNDPNNVENVKVRSFTTSQSFQKTLFVDTQRLNFGDVYSNVPTCQLLTIRNVSDEALEVHLDSSSSSEVWFVFDPDEEQNEEEEEGSGDSGSSSKENMRDLALDKSHSRIEEISLDVGEEKKIHVWYCPEPEEEEEEEGELSNKRLNKRRAQAEGVDGLSNINDSPKVMVRNKGSSSLSDISTVHGSGGGSLSSETGEENADIAKEKAREEQAKKWKKLGKLLPREFSLYLKCKTPEGKLKAKKTITGSARVCTSIIHIPRSVINLGDCAIGSWKSAVVEVHNISELPAKIAMKYQSKVVTFKDQDEIIIPAKQTADLKMNFVPRKINPDYRKEITMINLNNPRNDQFVEVRANNIDPLRITFHSLFYHVITPYSRNFLNFDNVIVGSPVVQTFVIKNVTKKQLRLEFKTSLPDELTLWKQGSKTFTELSKSPQSKTEQLLERFEQQEELRKKAMTDELHKAHRHRRLTTLETLDLPLKPELLSTGTKRRTNDRKDKDKQEEGQQHKTQLQDEKEREGVEEKEAEDEGKEENEMDLHYRGSQHYLDLAFTPSRAKHVFKKSASLAKLGGLDSTMTSPLHRSSGATGGGAVDRGNKKISEDNKSQPSEDGSEGTRRRGLQKRSSGENLHSQRRHSSSVVLESLTQPLTLPTPEVITLSHVGTLPAAAHPLEEEFILQQEKKFKGLQKAIKEGLLVPLSRELSNSMQEHFSSDIGGNSSKHRSKTTMSQCKSVDDFRIMSGSVSGRLRRQRTQSTTAKQILTLDAEERCVIYVVFQPSPDKRPWLRGKLKKVKGTISMKLIRYDRDMLKSIITDEETEDIPVRELLVTANICRSIMELAQKHINFGTVTLSSHTKSKSLVVNNLSEVPLLYRVKKSGSIASMAMEIAKEDRVGIIRPYRRREMRFQFKPTLSGPFSEKLIIENIYDPTNTQIISVKAFVKPKQIFFIQSLDMDFAICALRQKSKKQKIVFSNVTNQKRIFEIRRDENAMPESCDYDVYFRPERKDIIILTKDEEVEIAGLQQKVKIGKRKSKDVSKLEQKIRDIRSGLLRKKGGVSPASSSAADHPSTPSPSGEGAANIPFEKNLLQFTVEPNGVVSIIAILRPKPKRREKPSTTDGDVNKPSSTKEKEVEVISGKFIVNETKNVDAIKAITWKATLCRNETAYARLTLQRKKEEEVAAKKAVLTSVSAIEDDVIISKTDLNKRRSSVLPSILEESQRQPAENDAMSSIDSEGLQTYLASLSGRTTSSEDTPSSTVETVSNDKNKTNEGEAFTAKPTIVAKEGVEGEIDEGFLTPPNSPFNSDVDENDDDEEREEQGLGLRAVLASASGRASPAPSTLLETFEHEIREQMRLRESYKLTLEPSTIELGKVQVGEKVFSEFYIKNEAPEPISFDILYIAPHKASQQSSSPGRSRSRSGTNKKQLSPSHQSHQPQQQQHQQQTQPVSSEAPTPPFMSPPSSGYTTPSFASSAGGKEVGDESSTLMQFDQYQGTIAPNGGVRRIGFSMLCLPPIHAQSHRVVVRNLSTLAESTLTVELTPIQPRFLRFPSLEVDEQTGASFLDLGFCYVTEDAPLASEKEAYAKVCSIPIENVSEKNLVLSLTTNISAQAVLFQDEALQQSGDFVYLPSKEQRTVYICILPNRSRFGKSYKQGVCRDLIGGIRIKVHDQATMDASMLARMSPPSSAFSSALLAPVPMRAPPSFMLPGSSSSSATPTPSSSPPPPTTDHAELAASLRSPSPTPTISSPLVEAVPQPRYLYERTIKFMGVIGQSVLKLSEHYSDLGVVHELGKPVQGRFVISNMTEKMPLHWEMQCTSLLTLSVTSGLLAPRNEGGDHHQVVTYSLLPTEYGLFEEEILVFNKDNGKNPVPQILRVRLFVEQPVLQVTQDNIDVVATKPKEEKEKEQEKQKEANIEKQVANELPTVSVLDFGVLYLQGNVVEQQHKKEEPTNVEEGEERQPQPHHQHQQQLEEDMSLSRNGTNWQQLYMTNASDETLTLRVRSDIDMFVFHQSIVDEKDIPKKESLLPLLEEKKAEWYRERAVEPHQHSSSTERQYRVIGHDITLRPFERVLLHFFAPDFRSNHNNQPNFSRKLARLFEGKLVPLTGTILLENVNREQLEREEKVNEPSSPSTVTGKRNTAVMKVINLKASYCISMGRISPNNVQLDKITNVFEAKPFQFLVENTSESPLCCLFEDPLPEEITIEQPFRLSSARSSTSSSAGEDSPNISSENLHHQKGLLLVPALSSVSVSAVLDAARIRGSSSSFGDHLYQSVLTLHNLHNSRNDSYLHLCAPVQLQRLSYRRLTDDNELVFSSPLMHPTPPDVPPPDEWFTIINTFDKPLEIQLSGQLNPAMADLISLRLLSRTSNTPLSKFTLPVGGSIDVKVRVMARKDSRMPSNWGKKYKDYPLGKLLLQCANNFTETVWLHGSLTPGPTFSLSSTRLHFRKDEEDHAPLPSDSFMVKNLSSHFPLKLEIIEVNGSNKDSLSVKDIHPHPSPQTTTSPSTGNKEGGSSTLFQILPSSKITVPAASTKQITIRLNSEKKNSAYPTNKMFQDVHFLVRDVHSPLTTQTVFLSCLESHKTVSSRSGFAVDTSSILAKHSSKRMKAISDFGGAGSSGSGGSGAAFGGGFSPSSLNRLLAHQVPLLALRGCTPVPSSDSDEPLRYEINVGRRGCGSGLVHWELTLEYSPSMSLTSSSAPSSPSHVTPISSVSSSPRIYSLKDTDDSWLTLSRNGGILEKLGDRQQLVLTFSTERMDFYSTYVIVENLDNPKDVKYIKVDLEVVESSNASYFSIIVGGEKLENPTIDIGEATYARVNRNHSFILSNDSRMPLDFLLNANLSPHEATEVGFSLSRTSLKLFNALTIDAMSSVRVFIHFHPREDEELHELLSKNPRHPIQRTNEIYVSCSLVKDYQQTITLKATCYAKQLQASRTSLTFSGSIFQSKATNTDKDKNKENEKLSKENNKKKNKNAKREDDDGFGVTIEESSQQKELQVFNLWEDPLEYCVRNDSLFFLVEGPLEEFQLQEGSGTKVSVESDVGGDNIRATIWGKGASHTLIIKPNLENIYKNRKLFLREKYIEEHISLYNRTRPSENYSIGVLLSLGNFPKDLRFYTSPGLKNAYPYMTLEERIASFLRNFRVFWKEAHASLLATSNSRRRHRRELRASSSSSSSSSSLASSREETEKEKEKEEDEQVDKLKMERKRENEHREENGEYDEEEEREEHEKQERKSVNTEGSTEGLTLAGTQSLEHGLVEALLRSVSATERSGTSDNEIIALLLSLQQQEKEKAKVVHQEEPFASLLFDYHYITDELVFFGLKKQVGKFAFRLAHLVYCSLFRHELFRERQKHRWSMFPAQSLLLLHKISAVWVQRLSYFLLFFPEQTSDLDLLRMLERNLRQHLNVLQSVATASASSSSSTSSPSSSSNSK
ncbi:Autophagy-related protein 2 [Balamuthia mandrillaris]